MLFNALPDPEQTVHHGTRDPRRVDAVSTAIYGLLKGSYAIGADVIDLGKLRGKAGNSRVAGEFGLYAIVVFSNVWFALGARTRAVLNGLCQGETVVIDSHGRASSILLQFNIDFGLKNFNEITFLIDSAHVSTSASVGHSSALRGYRLGTFFPAVRSWLGRR